MTQRARERRWKAECDVGARGGDGRTEARTEKQRKGELYSN